MNDGSALLIPLPEEYFLTLRWNCGQARLLCTKSDLPELCLGFLYNSGLLTCRNDLDRISVREQLGIATVQLRSEQAGHVPVRLSGLGGEGIDSQKALPVLPLKTRWSRSEILSCMNEMDRQAVRYRQTGGMHCSALFRQTELLSCYEDIGRHNTLDKLSGDCFLREIDPADCMLLTTGRISEDMVRKAAVLGASLLGSKSTATAQAFRTAEIAHITLVTRIRDSFQVLSHPERICEKM